MDGPVFDAMLKTALEEALREDLGALEQETAAPRPSPRQRRRMRRMLADPWGYARRLRSEERRQPEETPRRRRNPARWLTAAAVIVVLLTGTAAGYALRGGAFFQRMFDESAWAARYAGAADTEQLLNMGGGGLGVAVEDEHFRFELLDAISEGENAMAAVRITVLDMTPLEEAFGSRTVAPGRFLEHDGSFLDTGSTSASYIYPDTDNSLAENQFLMVFQTAGNGTGARTLTINFHDFGYTNWLGEDQQEQEDIVLVPGTWTVPVELTFDGGTVLEKGETVTLDGRAVTVDRVRISALTVGMDLHCDWEDTDAVSEALMDAVFRMDDGTEVTATGYRYGGGGEDEAGFASEVLYEFGMPLEKGRLSAIVIGGQEIALK